VRLVGKYGEVIVNENECTAVIVSPLLEKKYGSVVQFDVEDLPTWIKRLKIVGTADGNIRLSTWK
jgi:hypothetical protein